MSVKSSQPSFVEPDQIHSPSHLSIDAGMPSQKLLQPTLAPSESMRILEFVSLSVMRVSQQFKSFSSDGGLCKSCVSC